MREEGSREHELYKMISFIKISAIRLGILKELKKNPKFPSELVRRLNTNFSTISRNIKKLKGKNIIFCCTPQIKKGRLYALTEKGSLILKIIEEEINFVSAYYLKQQFHL